MVVFVNTTSVCRKLFRGGRSFGQKGPHGILISNSDDTTLKCEAFGRPKRWFSRLIRNMRVLQRRAVRRRKLIDSEAFLMQLQSESKCAMPSEMHI